MPESQLITDLKARDPDALAQVFHDYSDKLYRLAVSLLHDEQQADGVVQNAFLKLIQHIDKFEGRSNISTWLYRVAYNECMHRLKQKHPQDNLTDYDEADTLPTCLVDWAQVPEQVLGSQEALTEMENAVQSLSPTLRAVFLLRDVEEFSTSKTASILEISESAVKVRLHRARLALREKLATYFTERVQ